MRIDRAGVPFVAAALVPAAALALARRSGLALPLAALGGFFAWFFRDPERVVPQGEGLVVSPADGRVMTAGAAEPQWAPPGDWKQVTIFLSPLDVHINRTPVAGRVTRVEYRPGSFLPAYDAHAGANEQSEIWLEHDGQPIVVRQVVGVLARRIVCRVQAGDELARGERIGLMKFGSRMDVFLPPSAALRVEPGQTVIGGETVIAVLQASRAG